MLAVNSRASLGAHGGDLLGDFLGRHHGRLIDSRHAVHRPEEFIDALRLELIA